MQAEKKIDNCPFCGHIIMRRYGKCPNCRKMIEELFFEPIYCPHCNKKSQINKGQCILCNGKINVPEIEVGKYIEIAKKRRLNLVSEREEKIIENLKILHFGNDPSETNKLIEIQAARNKKLYRMIFVIGIVIQAVFILLSLVTGIFQSTEPMPVYQLEPKKFFIPIFLWFIIKAVTFSSLFYLSLKKPVFSYFFVIVLLIVTYLFESLTFPAAPLFYTFSQIICLLLYIYGVIIALEYEDYITHFI